MRQVGFICLMLLFSLPAFAQERDTSFKLTDYYLKNVEEKPYDIKLLDSVKNTKVALIPPEHFVYAEKIPGYIHPGTSASIQIKDIEGTSWTIIDKVMTKEHLESQGVEFIGREKVKLFSGLNGVIYTVSFESKGVKFERKMLFTGDYNYTIWLNANYPVSLKESVIKPLMNSLLSANIINN